nr:hypothetical protein [Tanacetum cinerariifolium]
MLVIDDEETLILIEESRSRMSEKEKDPEAIKQNISYKPSDCVCSILPQQNFRKRFKPQQELSTEQAFWLRMFDPTSKPSDALPIKIEVPKELPKIILVNESLKKLKFHLAKFDNVVKIRTTPNAHIEGFDPQLQVEHFNPVGDNIGCPDCSLVSGLRCLKHMTGNRSQLMNFVSKFLGTVRFENDHSARIMGFGDYQMGNVTISRVYYVKELGHNLFFVGVDLISGYRDTNLYIISLDDMLKTSLICLLSKASKTKSWLWHCRLSHLNFGTLNKLAKDGLTRGILRLKLQKDRMCSAYALGISKKTSHQPKAKDTNQEKLYLLDMDLGSPMRVASINEKIIS